MEDRRRDAIYGGGSLVHWASFQDCQSLSEAPALAMEYPRSLLGKQPRPASSASATSRKNKLQRCSVCGGLGHKSRTCDLSLKGTDTQDLSDCLSGSLERRVSNGAEPDDRITDARAAYVLLNLSADTPIDLSVLMPPPPAMAPHVKMPAQTAQMLGIAPAHSSHMPSWQYPSSMPQLLMT